MELNGDVFIAAPRARVWQALNSPEALQASIPGCEELRQISPLETHARVLVKLGPVRARFVGKLLRSEVREGEGCVLNFEGSGGAAGFAKGRSVVALESEGEGTRLRYSAEASVGGKLGQIGARMIDSAAKQMAGQFFTALGEHLGTPTVAPAVERGVPQPVPAMAAPPAAPAGEAQRLLWFAMGVLATSIGYWLARVLA